ncbi:hypothetical protein FIU95_14670 [Microbulbifer sp. THAF38]|nr:hypothetical protein FIU95_14670 [Microbulbifer sp. THAF38]
MADQECPGTMMEALKGCRVMWLVGYLLNISLPIDLWKKNWLT